MNIALVSLSLFFLPTAHACACNACIIHAYTPCSPPVQLSIIYAKASRAYSRVKGSHTPSAYICARYMYYHMCHDLIHMYMYSNVCARWRNTDANTRICTTVLGGLARVTDARVRRHTRNVWPLISFDRALHRRGGVGSLLWCTARRGRT